MRLEEINNIGLKSPNSSACSDMRSIAFGLRAMQGMRRQIVFIVTLVALILLNACESSHEMTPSESSVIDHFFSSETFRRIRPFIMKYGEVNVSQAKQDVFEYSQRRYSIFRIPLQKNGQTVGVITAVDLVEKGFLPYDDIFAVNLEVYSNLNRATLTGTIEMFDLNYDNFLHSRIDVVDNRITKWEGDGLSQEMKFKYSYLRKHSENGDISLSRTETYTCDRNKNGDISFSECYSCVKQSIEMDGTTSFFCDIPISGWLGCWSVSTTFCVVLSTVY